MIKDSPKWYTNSISTLRQYAWEIFSALAYLQQHNIIHAALSPHNVMLTDDVRVSSKGLCDRILIHFIESHQTLWLWSLSHDWTHCRRRIPNRVSKLHVTRINP